ncbi:MAG: TonB-dependent receptor [Luteitalea sp.]|nr:TonB-dependent receptor [Luteitalea sp.]
MIRVLAVACLLLPFTTSAAQAQPVGVSGTVLDQTGAVVPGASVTIVGTGGRFSDVSGASGGFAFPNIPSGTYEVSVSLLGFSQETLRGVVVTDMPVVLPPMTLTTADRNETVIVTASRTETALIDAPATISIISEDVLASTSSQNYGDLLRSVPGINAVQLSARDVNLTSRQASSTLSNTQLVLLDGRSIYLDFFGLVLWDFLPTNLSDIKQIEVVRGPASAVWGANALTGAVNIITKSPRESVGTSVVLNAGGFGRGAGSTRGQNPGALFGGNATIARAPNDRWSYRLSAGYFNSDPLPRPVGLIPTISDPRAPGATIGGAPYPSDETGTPGSSFRNGGTSQPKFDARVDQELADGRITYAGGVAGTAGIIHTGIGPFDIQPGSTMSYGKVGYTRNGLRVTAFANYTSAEAPNLLLPDPATGRPLQLNFKTPTFDLEISDSAVASRRHLLTYGGNVRRNNFDITIAPNAENRTEFGGYLQDEIFLDRVRITAGARVDKFGNLSDPVFSPRLSATFKAAPEHAVRASFNRAFRSPSVVNNFIDLRIVSPVDLRGLAPLLPPGLQPLVASPFPLVVNAVGSELPINGVAQDELTESSLNAYEVAYTGTLLPGTTVTAAFYVNDLDNDVNFAQLPTSLDPYTAANPPPGWQLPPSVLTLLAAQGVFLPRTAFTYLNLGPVRQKGLELSLDQRVTDTSSAFVNYSWQSDPTILDDDNPFPALELALPPTHRFNAGFNLNGQRYLASGAVNYSGRALWSDVLTSAYHGFTDAYTLVNGTFGMKWAGGRITTSIKATNILNDTIQQHIFGDLLKRSVTAEVRLSY